MSFRYFTSLLVSGTRRPQEKKSVTDACPLVFDKGYWSIWQEVHRAHLFLSAEVQPGSVDLSAVCGRPTARNIASVWPPRVGWTCISLDVTNNSGNVDDLILEVCALDYTKRTGWLFPTSFRNMAAARRKWDSWRFFWKLFHRNGTDFSCWKNISHEWLWYLDWLGMSCV